MMRNTMGKWLEGVTNQTWGNVLRSLFQPLYDRYSSRALTTAGLAIKAGASPVVKAGTSSYFLANGVLRNVAANTDMPALVGTVTNATFNVFCFFIDQTGALVSAIGTGGASLQALQFPQFPVKNALIGFIIVNPTGAGDFVGGTTALDDGTVIPNVVYVNSTSGFDPYVLIGRGHVNV